MNLVEVFTAMAKANDSLPDSRDANAVKKYFDTVYPEMDFERVYPSDMKKMVKWFESLKKHKIEIKLSELPEEAPESVEEVEEEAVVEEKPKKAGSSPKTDRKKPTTRKKKSD